MKIQWFPGHMTKALRMMESKVKLIDSFIYILDARAPYSSINPQFNKLIEGKPILYVLNKSDLIEKKDLEQWLRWFSANNMTAVPCVSTVSAGAKTVADSLVKLNVEKINRQKTRGIQGNVKAMVIGMPNTGKSTLINCLANEKKAITGNRPGVTRGGQWVKVGNGTIILLDTPGTLCHSIETMDKALRLAYVGCIRDAVLDTHELSLEFLNFLMEKYPNVLRDRFKQSGDFPEVRELFDNISRIRGYILKGGEIDYDRASVAILDEFRKAKMGKLILELPEDIKKK